MHNLGFALEGAGRVLAVCLVLGAGLPALFTLGVRALAHGAGGEAQVHETGVSAPVPHRAATLAAYACFAIVLLAVALGIAFIVASGFGKALSFEHVIPTLVDKR
jgi:hypothetical protein